jgi:hypothetical protein
MTREKYFKIQEQLERPINEKDIPPSMEDLPEEMVEIINVFNSLGDRTYPDIGYMGKDYTNLQMYIDVYQIEDKEFCLEVLNWLDSRAINKSAEQLKREYDRLKSK